MNSFDSIAVVAPRGMAFSPSKATSIDLHIHETVCWSKYREKITVCAEEIENPFDGVSFRFWQKKARIQDMMRIVEKTNPGIIVVHQHLPTATAFSRHFNNLPVCLIRHNFQKPPSNIISSITKNRQFNRLAQIGFVSECCKDDFLTHWPKVKAPKCVVLNGVDTNLWKPEPEKEKLIVFVGRMAPEKGALEAAEALVETLSKPFCKEWRGLFIVTNTDDHPDYFKQFQETIAKAGHRIELLKSISHDQVRHFMGKAAISLAPTQNREPFGRVAIEALASGATLIASARGGFVEIVEDAGILLDEPNATNIKASLEKLILDEAQRIFLSSRGLKKVSATYNLPKSAATFDKMIENTLPMLAS